MATDLMKYIPPILQDVAEFKALAIAENPEFDEGWIASANIRYDQFIMTLTENGLKRWEGILDITPKLTDTLDLRRFRILARLNEQTPYTYRTVKGQIELLCGENNYTFDLQNEIYKLKVRVGLAAKGKLDEVNLTLRKTVPANIVIDLALLYNQHMTLGLFTHQMLKNYTHDGLRNEVING